MPANQIHHSLAENVLIKDLVLESEYLGEPD
jgi:hypothetical protein